MITVGDHQTMTVAELIALLSMYAGNAPVFLSYEGLHTTIDEFDVRVETVGTMSGDYVGVVISATESL